MLRVVYKDIKDLNSHPFNVDYKFIGFLKKYIPYKDIKSLEFTGDDLLQLFINYDYLEPDGNLSFKITQSVIIKYILDEYHG